MFKIICVTSRGMCDDFFERAGVLYKNGVTVILREKDLSESEYERLAKSVIEVCPNIILHTFADAAKRLKCRRIHLPMHILRTADLDGFDVIGASVHSKEEALEAQTLGASYVTAGHIFATDCKKGVPPRGLDFLSGVCNAVTIPVYAIGGISPKNAQSAINAGASGVCVMSGLMKCADAAGYLKSFKAGGMYDKKEKS